MGLSEVLAAAGFFGAFFICPLIYLLLKHQREMTQLLSGRQGPEVEQRIAQLEQRVAELQASVYQAVLRADDERSLRSRTGE